MNRHAAVCLAYLLTLIVSICFSFGAGLLEILFYFRPEFGSRIVWNHIFVLCAWLWPFFGGMLSRKSIRLRDVKWPHPGVLFALSVGTVLLSQIAFYSQSMIGSPMFSLLSMIFLPIFKHKLALHTLETQLAWAIVSIFYATLFVLGGRAGYSVWNAQTGKKKQMEKSGDAGAW